MNLNLSYVKYKRENIEIDINSKIQFHIFIKRFSFCHWISVLPSQNHVNCNKFYLFNSRARVKKRNLLMVTCFLAMNMIFCLGKTEIQFIGDTKDWQCTWLFRIYVSRTRKVFYEKICFKISYFSMKTHYNVASGCLTHWEALPESASP